MNAGDRDALGRFAVGHVPWSKQNAHAMPRGEAHRVMHAGCQLRGEAHPRHKVTERDVRDLRRRRRAGESVTALAAVFGISQTTVSQICLRRTWRHV